MVPHAARSTC